MIAVMLASSGLCACLELSCQVGMPGVRTAWVGHILFLSLPFSFLFLELVKKLYVYVVACFAMSCSCL
jgi:hypothetical protein